LWPHSSLCNRSRQKNRRPAKSTGPLV